MNEVSNQLAILIRSEPMNAAPNPFTSNPDTRLDTINSMMALITNVKSPNVTMVMGSVRIKRTGRKNALSIPRNAAAKNAEKNPLTTMPSIK
jgi:hypothetical protein